MKTNKELDKEYKYNEAREYIQRREGKEITEEMYKTFLKSNFFYQKFNEKAQSEYRKYCQSILLPETPKSFSEFFRDAFTGLTPEEENFPSYEEFKNMR